MRALGRTGLGRRADGLEPARRRDGRRASFDFPPVDRGRLPAVLDALRAVAVARGVTVARVALALLLHQPVVTAVIIGANRPNNWPTTWVQRILRANRRRPDCAGRRERPAA